MPNAVPIRALGLGVALMLTLGLSAATASELRASGATPAAGAEDECTGTVTTADGPVCGLLVSGDQEYLGIPYAAPPIGDLRWSPPQPPAPWDSPLQATQPGQHCIGSRTGSEDCLWLSVYLPHGGGTGLPVMVWIHGGGFDHDDDSGNGIGTDVGSGQDLANREHVIVVRVSYRLGAFGFLASKALGDSSGDYGLEDQQAALTWVHHNITAFGGDSNNVTVFGQSAGASSTCLQLLAPGSRGLFQRVIIQSGQYQSFFSRGSCAQTLESVTDAEATTSTLAGRVGCGAAADLAACLRAVPDTTLLSASAGLGFPPVINSQIVPQQPQHAFATGQFDRVPVITGVARNEDLSGSTISEAQYLSTLQRDYGPDAPHVQAQYPLSAFPSPALAVGTAVSDQIDCQSLTTSAELSRWVPTYTYEWDDLTELHTGATPAARDVLAGAYHASDVPALFPGWNSSGLGRAELLVGADQNAMIAEAQDYWGAFGRQGAPEPAHLPAWPAYTETPPAHAAVMSLQPAYNSHIETAGAISADHNCGFWAQIPEH